ncbi:MAG: hypothetical protein CVV18_08615 [Gammaproteobacteria bacterium HGW-Gammaproteobacteria-8]|nr:MAG: hypothetical protein CVV18_08615 [Gammaproteobacteria bacterium HGW-Gammaproteobacteria-8]
MNCIPESVADALFTTTQRRLLSLLYGQPERSFYFKEILRRTGMGVATVKRELDGMVDAGILTRTKIGNQHHYQANPACMIHDELGSIVRKTIGLAGPIRAALEPLSDRIDQAFVYGSTASGKAGPDSDIDLLVIGEVTLSEIARALYSAQEALEREINPRVYSSGEWQQLVKSDNRFVHELLGKPRINLLEGSQ